MNNTQTKISATIIVRMLVVVVAVSFLPVLVSGLWNWWEGWVFGTISLGSFVIGRVLLARRNPELVVERARLGQQKDTKPWDKILSPLMAFGSLLISLVAGLDIRFGWSPGFGLPVQLIALFIILAGTAFGTWALLENRFFSAMVRIQTDRGHQVVSTGPYRWIRHPGYVGTFFFFMAMPFFLNSVWALLPAALLLIAGIIRTSLEDRTLQDELEGYREYAQRVRYRLVPGIW